MKIAIDIRCLMEKQQTGIGEYATQLLEHIFFQSSGYEFILYLNNAQNVDVPKFPYSYVKFFETRYPNKFFNLSLSYLNRPNLDEIIGGADLFWLPNLQFFSISSRCPLLLTIHDLSFLRYPEFLSWRSLYWHTLIKIRRLAQRADKIITISQNTANDIEALLGIHRDKIEVHYPGINPMFQNGPTIEQQRLVFEKYQLPKNYVLFLSNLEPRKNLINLLYAMKRQQPDVTLVVAGARRWHYQKIEKVLRNLGLVNVKFLNYVESADKPALYKMAQLFIYPSFYEGFGFPPLEAMAVGTPVVASSAGSLPEVLGSAAILVNPHDVAALSGALTQGLNDIKLRQRLVIAGLTQVKKYQWSKTAEQTLKIFEKIK